MELKIKESVEELLAWAEKQPPTVYCRHCGRPLSDPQSVAAGIGPICVGKAESEGEGE